MSATPAGVASPSRRTSRGSTASSPASRSARCSASWASRDVVKLASNENPLGPSPQAVEAGRAALAEVNRYPDPQATELRAALSARASACRSPTCWPATARSRSSTSSARAFLGPGDNAVISEHAFVRFRQIVTAHNRGARLVPMRDWTHDLAGDGAGDRRADAARLRREPEQPDRHLEPARRGRGARGRAAPGLPARAGRGVLRVRRRPRLPGRRSTSCAAGPR